MLMSCWKRIEEGEEEIDSGCFMNGKFNGVEKGMPDLEESVESEVRIAS